MSDIAELIFGKDNEEEEKEEQRRIDGILIGTVSNNYLETQKDKVEVEVNLGGSADTIKVWAKFMMPTGGETWGMFYKPEVGDKVIVSFVGGNIKRPFILGCVYKKSGAMVNECSNEKNSIKTLKTKSGTELKIEVGDKGDHVSIKSSKGNEIFLDDENSQIVLTTTNGAKITMGGSESDIKIEDTNSIQMITGSSKMSLDKQGNIKVECTNLNLEATNKLVLKGNQVELSATTLKAEAKADMAFKSSATAKVEAGAMLQVKGAMVKIN